MRSDDWNANQVVLMSKDCSELCEIISEWFADIEKVKKTWEGIRAHNPDFEQVSAESWHKKEARLWLHEETRPFEANELERWLVVSPPLSKNANSLAIDHYSDWNERGRIWCETNSSS